MAQIHADGNEGKWGLALPFAAVAACIPFRRIGFGPERETETEQNITGMNLAFPELCCRYRGRVGQQLDVRFQRQTYVHCCDVRRAVLLPQGCAVTTDTDRHRELDEAIAASPRWFDPRDGSY